MEWVDLWVGHIRGIRIKNEEIKEEGEPTEKDLSTL